MSPATREILNLDRTIHEPARLLIVSVLYVVESADFLYLKRETGLTKGNLSSHLNKLEKAGYVEIEKTYRGKIPQTICQLSQKGHAAFDLYRQQMTQTLKE